MKSLYYESKLKKTGPFFLGGGQGGGRGEGAGGRGQGG